ncbi:RNA polymerase subunit sigma-70 [Leptospira sp. 96542]|nr:RNA polymerase subunit sigma-70 [Leptospira sp. 96542]
MLPKICDANLLQNVQKARLENNPEPLKSSLPIWMVDRLSKKRRITEDEGSEILLAILEVFPKMWKLSLAYQLTHVMGFFVTFAFNQYRNRFRAANNLDAKQVYLQLWRDKQVESAPEISETQDIPQSISFELLKLGARTSLILCLKFGIPFPKSAKQLFIWKLREKNILWEDFERGYELRKSKREKKDAKIKSVILRYTRLLYETKDPNRRLWYLKQKRHWIRQRDCADNRSFFSEREIVKYLGISRKQVRNEIQRGKLKLKASNHDLLHCA